MKRFLIPVVLILLTVTAGLAWRNHQQFSAARSVRERLLAQAASLGMANDPAIASAPIRFNRGQRADRSAAVSALAADFIDLGVDPLIRDEARLRFMDRLALLDASELKQLLAELRKEPGGLEYPARGEFVSMVLLTLSSTSPRSALALCLEPDQDSKTLSENQETVVAALGALAGQDPVAAFEWFQQHGATISDLKPETALRNIISNAAIKHPAIAFQLVARLNAQDTDAIVSDILLNTARTSADRDAVRSAFNHYLNTISDEEQKTKMAQDGITKLASNAAREGFEAGSKWLSDQKFSEQELSEISRGRFANSTRLDQAAQWIEWSAATFPGESSQKAVTALVKRWTNSDYQAIGRWLTTAPAGPAKNASIQTFAGMISPYHPESSAEWALTLPDGKPRTDLLRTIREKWSKEDPTAAADFAAEHGIK